MLLRHSWILLALHYARANSISSLLDAQSSLVKPSDTPVLDVSGTPLSQEPLQFTLQPSQKPHDDADLTSKKETKAASSFLLSPLSSSSKFSFLSISSVESPLPSTDLDCLNGSCNKEQLELAFDAVKTASQSPALIPTDISSLNLPDGEVNDSALAEANKIALESAKYINLSNITNIDLSEAVDDQNSDNLTEDCRFMSFEEWKQQKKLEEQKKSEQEAKAISDVAARHKEETTKAAQNNSLDVIVAKENKTEVKKEQVEDQGRTYKDKFNYASADCAATVVSTNSDAKGASAILKEVKDSYLLNKCSTPNKFVVIELCQDILVDRVIMGNFELFSSMFKSVKFSVSDRFPVTSEWKELGVFEADNIRDLQTFDIENPLIWARYLRIDIVSHYGNEFYCPISIVRVHGTTMMEEFKSSDQVVSTAVSQIPEESAIANSAKLLNYSSNFDEEDECRVVLPYLALNEFLKDINSTEKYCEVRPASEEPTILSTESATVKATTQESILKNIVNRLSLLESNASLSLLYVEEQSKLLSDAFTKLEKRHAFKFETLIQKLNHTVTAQVSFLEAALNNIKQESKLLFDSRDGWTSSVLATVGEENRLLSRELSFQRKIVVIDTLLILALLAYVIITREFSLNEEPAVVERIIPRHTSAPIKPFPIHSKRSKGQKRRKKKF